MKKQKGSIARIIHEEPVTMFMGVRPIPFAVKRALNREVISISRTQVGERFVYRFQRIA